MGGKTSKSTQTVSIPPEVLARYNAVNARAEDVASRPFQPYSYNPADFVAQLTPTQLAGIQNVNYAAGQAQPYFDEATGQLMGAQMAATPYYAQAEQDIGAGQYMGQAGSQAAQNLLYGGMQYAMPLNQQALGAYQQGYGQGQQLLGGGVNQFFGAQAAAQPYTDAATQQYYAGLAAAQPLQQYALETLGRAGGVGEVLSGEALRNLQAGGMRAEPLQQLAQGIYGQAYQAAQPYNQAALQQYYGGLGAAGPLSQAAAANIAGAQAGVAPYQQFATELGLAAARPVSPGPLGGAQIAQYMSPYIQNVVAPTAALMNQQAQQAQASQLGNAIRSGAFGGDRAAIAAANLQQQQALAQSKALSDIMQSGYGQALAAAQQQQGIGLSAEQANRAAQQAAAGQLLGVGQAGFGQNITAAQQQAALAQQLFGQQATTGQNIAGLGQQAFGQGLASGQAQQALAQQLFGQGATTAQQQASIAQALFGQGATQAAQQAAIAQQQFGQNAAAAQGLAALGEQLYGRGMGVGQALLGAGQQAFQQGQGFGQAQQGLGQQLYAQGLGASQQQAALAQQNFAQQLAAAQARQQLGQGLYGMGAGTAQQLAALGTGAQGAALQGAQAQLAAGQAQQQTAQAGLQALYNQFLQQQAYPFQVAQFLGNIAMGTGALSGSTTTTSQPGSLFSDIRTKENVREVGKTLDGQPIYSYNYKGDPKTQMGLIAQEVEERHPEAVGLAGGLKTVNYKKATRDAERRGEILDAEFSPISEGGSVTPSRAGLGFADGGVPVPVDETRRAEEEMRQKQQEQEMRNEQRAAQAAVETAKQQAPAAAPTAKVDLKPDLSAKPEVGGAVPQKQDIPTQAPNIPQLATASGEGLYKEDPRSQDAATIAKLLMFAFSDRRMKEDVKHIGFTHDGQKIYSYRIKGEPHTQIGLMADEVERHKPEAVGSMNGLKMVDYDRATEDAVRKSRGGFADGGSPGLANPSDMAALLQAQAQMFGPFGDYARTLSGTPGAPGYVPGANLPVASLVTAGDLPPIRSTADDIRTMLDLGSGIESLRRKPVPTTTTTTPAGSTTETETPGAISAEGHSWADFSSEIGRYRGGAAYADGGQVIPYATPTALNIPVEMKTPELMKAGSLPKQRSTMEDVADALGIASDVKSLMPKAYGGSIDRNGYQVGGNPTFAERFIPGIQTQEGVDENRRAMMDFIEKRILKNPYLNTTEAARLRDERMRMQPTSATPPAPTATAAPVAPAATTNRRQPSAPVVDPTAANKPLPSSMFANLPDVLEPGLAAAVQTPAMGAGPMPAVPPSAPAPVPAGGLAPPPAAAPATTPAAAATPTAPAGLQPPAAPAAAAPETKKKPGLMDWLRKEENYIPILRGAAAAAAAPTQYTLPALLVGAGAYGKAKGDIMQQLAEVESTKAATAQTEASARQTQAQTAGILKNLPTQSVGGREFVVLEDGSRMLVGQWLSLPPPRPRLLGQEMLAPVAGAAVPGATTPPSAVPQPTPGKDPTAEAVGLPPRSLADQAESQFRATPPVGQSRWVGTRGEDAMMKDFNRLIAAPQDSVNAELELSLQNRQIVDAAANAAYGTGGTLSQLTNSILKLPEEGVISGGPLSNFKANTVRVFNDTVNTLAPMLGINPAEYRISPEELGTLAAANKLAGFMKFAQAKGSGQMSFSGLEAAGEVVPTGQMSKPEAIGILSGMYVDKQKALDMQNYLNDYINRLNEMRPGQGNLYLTQTAMNSFRNEPDYTEARYLKDKKAIAALMSKKMKDGRTWFDALATGKYGNDVIDRAAGEALGLNAPLPGISRYILNQ